METTQFNCTPNNGMWPEFSEVADVIARKFPGSGIDPAGGEDHLRDMVRRMEEMKAPEQIVDVYRPNIGKFPDICIKPANDCELYLLARYFPGEYFRVVIPEGMEFVLDTISRELDFSFDIFT